MPVSTSFIKLLEKVDPGLREVLIALLEEMERQRLETVTKNEFNELKAIVKELAEAQKRTEEELRKLIGEHRKTREMLGTLQHTVGYVLEDRAFSGLPPLLKKDFGIEVIEPLRRDYGSVKFFV